MSLAKNRSRRAKTDKNGRLAALEKLRKTKETGQKNKYEVINDDNYCSYCYKCYVNISFSFKLQHLTRFNLLNFKITCESNELRAFCFKIVAGIFFLIFTIVSNYYRSFNKYFPTGFYNKKFSFIMCHVYFT